MTRKEALRAGAQVSLGLFLVGATMLIVGVYMWLGEWALLAVIGWGFIRFAEDEFRSAQARYGSSAQDEAVS
jgi:hypothetical protein